MYARTCENLPVFRCGRHLLLSEAWIVHVKCIRFPMAIRVRRRCAIVENVPKFLWESSRLEKLGEEAGYTSIGGLLQAFL